MRSIPLGKKIRNLILFFVKTNLRKKRRDFATLQMFSSWTDVWGRSAEIPYWQHVTTSIWVVVLIGRGKFALTNQEHHPGRVSDTSSIQYGISALAPQSSFGCEPLITSRNDRCFLRLYIKSWQTSNSTSRRLWLDRFFLSICRLSLRSSAAISSLKPLSM